MSDTTASFNASSDGQGPQQPGVVKVRFSYPADTARVLQHYRDNPHPHVDYRGDAVFTDRIENGRTLLVMTGHDEIALASMAYDFNEPGHQGSHATWIELGSTVGAKDKLRGFSMYPFAIASQVVHEFLTQPPADHFFACIYKSNPEVTKFLNTAVGWKFYDPDDAFIAVAGETPENAKNINWLQATTDTLPHQARVVLEVINKGYLENRKTGGKALLDLDEFVLANQYLALVQELAHGAFGRMLESCPPIPLAQTRDQFLIYMKSKGQAPAPHI